MEPVVQQRDEELVSRYLEARAEDAFRALYRQHSPYLYGLALRLCVGRRDDAEEALQEAWIRAARRLADFRWTSTLRTWLGGFVVNCCRERFRRRRGETAANAAPLAIARPADDGRLDIERLLARLPEGQRTVLVLHAIEGYTHEEIGGLLGIPAGTSKSRLSEARRALRQWRDAHRDAGDRS
jgi:RNA polymerase sigma-70 factor (ECF subfamily)